MLAMPGWLSRATVIGFRAKAFGDFRVVQLGVEDLDGDFAVQRLVDGTIDGAHAALPELVDNPVFSDVLPNHLPDPACPAEPAV